MSAAPRLLAVAYGGGHIGMLLPVLAALRQRRPQLQITLLALTTARRAALDAGAQPDGYADWLPQLYDAAEQGRALQLGAALLDANRHPDIDADESLAYLGVNALELERALGAEAAQLELAARGRQAFHPLGFFQRLLDRLQPDLVLTTNSPRSEQAALEAASARGIPTLAVLDLFALPGDAFAARTLHPQRVCVLAEQVADNLVAAGWDRARLRVTGNPAFDALHDPALRQRAADWRAARGWQQRRVVLLATQPELRAHPDSRWPAGDALPLALEATLRDWVAQRPQAALVVRHHPNHWHRLPRQPDTPQVEVSLSSEQPIEPLLRAADAVVVQSSTVGLQAACAGTPVLALRDAPSARHGFDYAALGVATGVERLELLPAALDAVLAAPPAPTAWAGHPRAAAAVADEALQLLEQRAR